MIQIQDCSYEKKLNKMQRNTNRWFNELRNQVNQQNKYFIKETETLKKNQIEVLEIKNSIKEINNKLASIGNRVDQMEERTSDIKNRNLEMIQRENRET